MISVAEAKKIIAEHVSPLSAIRATLNDAVGTVLAKDVFAPLDMPPFNQSSVDGYAFVFDDWQKHKSLTIKGEIPAGHKSVVKHSAGQAIRIFTGAPVPDGIDTVVMQEKTTISNGQLQIQDSELLKGNAIRSKGSEIKARQLALEKGSYLSPAAIGFLASIGIREVSVLNKIRVYIIVTGNELQQPGQPLKPGQIYESNSYTLIAALKQLNLTDIGLSRVGDSLEDLKNALNFALETTDVVLLTGGVSVGDYDLVLEAASKNKVSQLFHRIKQKPGKPLYFGKKKNKLVFGLPGNPSSVLTCFYEYVIPALQLLNSSIKELDIKQVPLANSYKKAVGLTHFLKGFYDGKTVTALDAQESYRLSSFAKANCLICINEETTNCNEADLVEIHLLPV